MTFVEERVDRLEQAMATLAEVQVRNSIDINYLKELQAKTEQSIERLATEARERDARWEAERERYASEQQEWQTRFSANMERQAANIDALQTTLDTNIERLATEARERDARWEAEREQYASEQQEQFAQWKAEHKRINREWGHLANKMGTLAEDMVAPNIPRIARELFGCERLEDFMVRRKIFSKVNRQTRREFDVIAVCTDKVLLNETKSSLDPRDMSNFASFVASGEFFDYFPEYRGLTLIPIFATLYIDDKSVRFLSRQGIYAMMMSDYAMDIVNYEQVQQNQLDS